MKASAGWMQSSYGPLMWLVVLVGLLRGAGYLAVVASDGGVLLLLLALWLPLTAVLFWRARQRRAIWLNTCLSSQSRWRIWLRGGVLMLLVQALMAVPMALLLLAVVSQPPQGAVWWLLMVAAPLWWLLWSGGRYLLRHDINNRFLSAVAGQGAVWVTGVLLMLAWLVASLWQPVAEVSSLTLLQAARLGQADAVAESRWLAAGAAFWHGIGYVQLWLVQSVTDLFPGATLALVAWLLLLVQGACFIWPVLLLMQGVTLMLERTPAAFATVVLPRRVWLPLLIVALAGWHMLAANPWRGLVSEPQVVQLGGNLYALPNQRLEQLLKENRHWLVGELAERASALDTLADVELRRLFADARMRVPHYAEWHYSLAGGMTRTAFGLMAYFDPENDRAVRALSERIFPSTLWSRRQAAFEDTMMQAYAQQQSLLRSGMLADLQRRLSGARLHPHKRVRAADIINLDALSWQWRESALQTDVALRQGRVALAVGSGAAAFSLASSVRSAAQARAAAAATARVAGRSSAAGSAALCAASGPAALGCALAVFTGVTLATEYAILKTDELLSREQLERDLIASIGALQQAARENYLQHMLQALREDSDSYHRQVLTTLRPIDQIR